MKSLVEQAKGVKLDYRRKLPDPTDEEIDLAIAWVKDEITFGQISRVLNIPYKRGGNTLYRVAAWLKFAYKNNKLNIERK